MTLASYAAVPEHSRGRRFPEPTPLYRSEYQRDRDRIIHSAAFRRLEYKTQVFVNHEGDLFRTRLTHSLEVAQIGRTVARSLALNEDLVEAISLAHDLGHTPFGHAGQDALNASMRDYGGFEHNLQSLRVVDELEDKYAGFPGLNLTYETREGILKHCSPVNARQLGELGERFTLGRQPGLEAQIANIADEIAYNNHDVDDGLRAKLISLEELRDVPLFRRHFDSVQGDVPHASSKQKQHETVRRMINELVCDLTENTRSRLESAAPDDPEAVRAHGEPLVGFSATVGEDNRQLKRFLREHMYRHHRVHRIMVKAQRVIRELFRVMFDDPRLMPPEFFDRAREFEARSGKVGRARVTADYIAGMTDRFAIDEFDRLFDPRRLC